MDQAPPPTPRPPLVRKFRGTVGRPTTTAGILTRDPVTGAYSRALFETRLRAEIEAAQERRESVSLCMLDLDYFKSVNDAYGHRRGDQLLRELVRRLQAGIRRSDLLFRFGGDEFVLLLPHTDKAQAAALAERLLQRVQAKPFGDEPPISLSISVGVATSPGEAAEADALLDLADRRHFDAKRRGRGNVVADDSAANQEPARELARLVERDGAFERLHHFLAKSEEHGRGVLVIRGAPGSGRTRFLETVELAARQRGYGLLRLPGAIESADDLSLPISPAGIPAFIETLRQRQQEQACRGWLIAVDRPSDHDSDPPLGDLARPVLASAGTDIGPVILAYTSGFDIGRHDVMLEDATVETIELRPLTATGVSIWLRSLLHLDPSPPFVDWLHQQTQGFPGAIRRAIDRLTEWHVLYQNAEQHWMIRPDYADLSLIGQLGLHPATPSHNLPAALTDFIGREADLQRVRELLAKSRLVTLTGPGGIGKTRLALQTAHALLAEFHDGVYFVPLAAISDPALVPSALASVLGVKEVAGQSLIERLKEFLRPRQQLLIFDNVEQVVDAAPLISELLAVAPQLKALVTSRQALRLYGEHVFSVPPLDLPDLAIPTSAEILAQCASPALFASRAQAVNSDFTLTDENASAVAELCVRLDGLPLAIELAAACCDELTPGELLTRMGDRLALLNSGPRDLPARQRTLRGAIEWGYQLLRPEEQWRFAELAVFAGRFTLEAAEQIHQPLEVQGSAPIETEATARQLTSLTEKSLLRDEGSTGTPVYMLLETIREYALEQLEASGRAEATRRRHAGYFVGFAEEAAEQLKGAEQKEWLNRLDRTDDDMRAALAWALQRGDAEIAGRLGLALWRYWEQRGRAGEGRSWLGAILAQGDALEPALRAQILISAGVLAWYQGDHTPARTHLEAGLALSRQLGDAFCTSRALNNLGLVARQQGDFERARAYFEECLTVNRAIGDRWAISIALGNLGRLLLLQGDPLRAQPLIEESLAISRDFGDLANASLTLRNLGLIAFHRHDFIRATELFDEALQAAQEVGNLRNIASALACLGITALRQDDRARAATLLSETLARWRDLGYKEGIAEVLEGLGGVAGAYEQPQRAARLFGAAEALREAIGVPIPPFIQVSYDRLLALAKDRPSPAAWEAAWQEGRATPLDQIIEEAFTEPY